MLVLHGASWRCVYCTLVLCVCCMLMYFWYKCLTPFEDGADLFLPPMCFLHYAGVTLILLDADVLLDAC